MVTDADSVVAKASALKSVWTGRNLRFKDWQKLRRLDNNLEETGYESFIGNDPKAFFNAALYMLSNASVQHRIPILAEDQNIQKQNGKNERALISMWRDMDKQQMMKGQSPWLRQFADYLLQTGWYAVQILFNPTTQKFAADIWNPAEVYQEYGDDGVISVAHMYSISAEAARAKIVRNGWPEVVKSTDKNMITVVNYWWYDEEGNPMNCVVMNKQFVKPPTPEEFFRVLTGPCNGFADRGIIEEESATGNWRQRMGESVLETNRALWDKFNKFMTFVMQNSRDAAQYNWLERSSGKPLATAETLKKRGGVYHYGPTDAGLSIIAPPDVSPSAVPVLRELGGMLERGALPRTFYGNIDMELSGYAISQMVSSAMQVLIPFQEVVELVMAEIDTIWLNDYKQDGKKMTIKGVYGQGTAFVEPFEKKDVPDGLYVDVTLSLALPNDLVQRAQIARQINPEGNFLDKTTLLDQVLHIQDPQMVLDKQMSDLTYDDQQARQLWLALKYMAQAEALDKGGQPEAAELFRLAAEGIKAQFGAEPKGQRPGRQPGLSPEVMPPEEGPENPDVENAMRQGGTRGRRRGS